MKEKWPILIHHNLLLARLILFRHHHPPHLRHPFLLNHLIQRLHRSCEASVGVLQIDER